MTTNLQLVRRAAEITLTNKSLWWLGIFLSSGFNLHAWYSWQWLNKSQLLEQILIWFQNSQVGFASVIIIGFILIGLLVVNFMKLVFFGQIHNQLHNLDAQQCLLCTQLKDRTVWQMLRANTRLWVKTVTVSVMTIAATIGVVSLFHFYTVNTNFNFAKAFLLMGSLIAILIGISWWNMLTVLFMMWHGQSLTKAAGLAFDLLMSRLRRVASLTILATVLFLISIVAGGLVLFQLPAFLASSPNYLFTAEVFASWQIFISVISGALFVFWMILNNFWFNVVMVMLFNELVASEKSPETAPIQLFANQPQPTPLHHSIDKSL